MIPALQTLARNTLVRDILFSDVTSPLLNSCRFSSNRRNFETELHYKDLLLQVDESYFVPELISEQVVRQLCEICPSQIPEWAILILVHQDTTQLALSNLSMAGMQNILLPSLIYKIFARCQKVKEIYFEMIDIAPGIFNYYILPKANQYTTISLRCCLSVRDMDVRMLLEGCSNLTTLNLCGSLISDDAFVNVQPEKIMCHDCGNQQPKRLKLQVLDISECSKLTTKSIRRLVDLCGPTLQCLYINQCSNMYTTALWYLCGLFKGKENFLLGDFTSFPRPFSCCCTSEDSYHRTAENNTLETFNKSTQSSSSIELDGSIVEEAKCDFEDVIESSESGAAAASGVSVIDNVMAGEIIAQHRTSIALADTVLEQAHSSLTSAMNPDSDSLQLPSDGTVASLDILLGLIEKLCDGQCCVLETFLRHTSEESTDGEENTGRSQPESSGINENDEPVVFVEGEKEVTTAEDCITVLSECFEKMRICAAFSCDELSKITNLEYDSVDISSHRVYQTTIKSVIKTAKKILEVLNDLHQMTGNPGAVNMHPNNEGLESHNCTSMIPILREKLVCYVKLLGLVSSEIRQNEILRLRLMHSVQLEAMQREELQKIRDLLGRLSTLYSNFEGMNQLYVGIEDVMGGDEEEVEEEVIQDANHGDDDDDEGESDVDEESPELINLLRSETKLLLEHAKYLHCPSCCTNAYTPRLAVLDICDIKYQSDELALLTLKGLVTVNRGLKVLNLSWSCIDNDTIEYVAVSCPDLKELSVQQCGLLSTPFLEYFKHHDLVSLDTLGISWLHDSDILCYLGQRTALSLTTLCLAESAITDISLKLLARTCKLKNLNLCWCDEITDSGIATIVLSSSDTLTTLLVRQCAISDETLKVLPLCSKLVQLDISTTVAITDALWMPLALGLPALEDLDISWVFGITNHKLEVLFSHTPTLKKLTADGHKQITTDIFEKMFVRSKGGTKLRSAQYIPNMRYISLQYCNDMEDDELYEIVVNCRGSLVIKTYYGEDLEYRDIE